MRKFYTLPVLFVFFAFAGQAQLTGITPNQAAYNQTLQTTITGNGIFIQSSSPSGNLYQIRLLQGVNAITIFDMNQWNFMFTASVTNPDTVVADLTIPYSTPSGLYDLEVITGDIWDPWSNQTTYTLPAAFTVIPPDGYVTGNVYDDLNRNGIRDGVEPGLSGKQVNLIPGNISVYTDLNGNFSIPASNGNYSLIYLHSGPYQFVFSGSDTIAVTINNANSAGNDYGMIDALASITPNTGFQGITSAHQIVSDRAIFYPGAQAWGNISQVYINSSPPITVPLNTNVTVIDSFTIQIVINVSAGTSIASNLDVRVYTTTGYIGYHYLRDQFSIAPPVAFVSGRMFFDQNQNKINDPNEPGIQGAGVLLVPDNSTGFANAAGEFLIGSYGGAQTLTPTYNIPGLSLFTDSASYTLFASGNVTGKDFGFISTYPDYSIDVSGFYIFPRCNSVQYAYFTVRNNSNTPYNLIAWLKPHPLMTYISAPVPPSSISNDTLYWNLSLDPYESLEIKAAFLLPGSGSVVTCGYGAISLDSNGNPHSYDEASHTVTIICSMDPNDKQATPPGIFLEHFTLMTDTLEYMIRFQNTGNDTAYNVVVLDTLDTNLDFSTFEIVGSSHSMQTELKSNGALRFAFNNIMLVDSNMNEPESHGHLIYRIRANTSLPDSTPVNNIGYIYFDFNSAVLTNTTLNTLVYVLPVGIAEINSDNGIAIYPNPFSQFTTMTFDNPSGEKYKLIITGITGKIVMPEMNTNGNMFVIEKDKMSSGMYFYNLVNTSNNTIRSGKILVE